MKELFETTGAEVAVVVVIIFVAGGWFARESKTGFIPEGLSATYLYRPSLPEYLPRYL